MSALPVRARRKAVMYITSGSHLLVFREPDYPEVGIQPPGGTVNEGETAEQGALRELQEETGLSLGIGDLTVIGQQVYEYEANDTLHRHHRYYFHGAVDRPTDETWMRVETNPDGADHEILFSLFWTPLEPELDLFGGLGEHLPALRRRLGLPGAEAPASGAAYPKGTK